MNKKELIVEKLDYGNKQEIKKLVNFLKNLFKEIDETKWTNEYVFSPESSHTFISKHHEKIIAHSAIIGLKFVKNGKVYPVSKFEGSLIDINYLKSLPKYYNKRVFEKICNELIDHIKKTDHTCIFGFPSVQASQTQKKAGFEIHKKKIKVSFFLLSIKKIFKKNKNIFIGVILNAFDYLNKLFIKICAKKNEDMLLYNSNFYKKFIDYQLNNSLVNPKKNFIYIDKYFIKWKFRKENLNQILLLVIENEINGYLIIKNNNDVTSILDISANSIFNYIKMLRHLIYINRNNKMKYLDIWIDNENSSKQLKISLFFTGFVFFYNLKKVVLFYSHLNSKLKTIVFKKLLLR